MCLNINVKIDEKVRRKLAKGGGKAKFWVIKKPVRGVLYSIYQGCCWCRRAGAVRSTRKQLSLTRMEQSLLRVNRGNHVFLTRRDAREHLKRWYNGYGYRVVPVWGYRRHFVAAGRFIGQGSAVFRTLTVTKKDFDKAIGRKP